MRKFLDRYYGTLRKIKANYVLLNIFNLKKLAHARRMFKKYGIQRSVLLPISSIDLPASPATELPWLDTARRCREAAHAPWTSAVRSQHTRSDTRMAGERVLGHRGAIQTRRGSRDQ